jgi:hypothetical protein
MLAVRHGESPYLRMWQGGWQNHALNERLRAQRQRRQTWIAARMVARAQGEDTPSEPKSMDADQEDEEEEGEITRPPPSPPHEALPSLDDIFRRQAVISISALRSKWTQTETRSSIGSRPHPHLALVAPEFEG